MDNDEEWMPYILQACKGLDYGTVTLVIHNGQIAQIERLEKFRFQTRKEEKACPSKLNKQNKQADQTH